MENAERFAWIHDALRQSTLDLLICALPANVLMLSGYWPVVGTGAAIAFADGQISLLIPEDEEVLARNSWANDIHTFHPASLKRLETAAAAIRGPLTALVNSRSARIGFEAAETSEPSSYAAMHLYGDSLREVLAECIPEARLQPADSLLSGLRARKTEVEIGRIRTACRIAERAFEEGASALAPNAIEAEVADAFRWRLEAGIVDFPEVQRAGGFVACMSGANSALAGGAYARSRAKKIEQGDLALIHCNSYADGYWTDITRTFCVGEPDDRQAAIFNSISQAREAALAAIAPGVAAAEVDRAARNVLSENGFGDAFTHSTGHGVGFGAIDAQALPRLHPKSPDVIEAGMVFNVEPAVYLKDYGGVRHCDLVAATTGGYELLTPFQRETTGSI